MPGPEQYLVHAKTRAFARHVDTARRIFDQAARHGKLSVSVSWGKDSIALLDIAIEHFGPGVVAMHMASPYALPCYDEVVAHFSSRCDLHTLPAKRTLPEYIEWCQQIGLPHERDFESQRDAVTSIKRDRADEWCDELDVRAQALGMRIAEKGPRAMWLRKAGPVYQMAKSRRWRACPLTYWSTADVWAYIFSRGLPYPRLYDCETHGQTRETLRNTGWLSTDGAHTGRLAWLRAHFPSEYNTLLDHFPRLRIL